MNKGQISLTANIAEKIFTDAELSGIQDLESIMIARFAELAIDIETGDPDEMQPERKQLATDISNDARGADPELCALLLFLHSEGDEDLWFDDFKSGYRFYGRANTYEIGKSRQYAVIPDSDIEDVYTEHVDNYIDECILPDMPEHTRNYFDREQFHTGTESDGYGTMASYDSADNEQEFNGETYHILRLN